MKRTLFILIFIAFISCRQTIEKASETPIEESNTTEVIIDNLLPDHFETIEIEGCEYLILNHTSGTKGYGYLSHKGNCKNSIHCHNQVSE